MSDGKGKPGRKPKLKHERKSKDIHFRVTEREYEKFKSFKIGGSSSSPALTNADILRKVLEQMDDKALLYFIYLDENDPLRIRLRQEYDFLDFKEKP